MRRIALILCLCLLAGASQAVPNAPAAAPTRPTPLADGRYTRVVLDNGMAVLLQEKHDMPWASINLFVRSGGEWEDAASSGLSHFSEHMFFRGTTHRTSVQVKQGLEGLGAQTNAETSKDFTHFFLNLPSAHILPALDIYADCLLNPDFQPKNIDIERQAVLDEYRMDADSEVGELEDKLYSLSFKSHPYRLSVIGTEANINRFSAPDFIAWRKKYYQPDRTALVIVGDFRTDELMPHIRTLFGPFARTGVSVAPIPEEAPMTQPVDVQQPSRGGAGIFMAAYRSPAARDHADVCAVDVMTFMIGQGRSSLLTSRLVTDKELAAGASLDFLTQRDPSLITLGVMASGPRLGAAKTQALAILAEVENGQFTDEQLDRAKSMLTSTFRFDNTTDSGIAGTLGLYEMIDNADFAMDYLDGVRHVTRDDVIRVAKKYLGAPAVQVTALPRRMMDSVGGSLPKPSTTIR